MLTLCIAAALAQDQDSTFDPERFKPPSDTMGFAVTESAATLEHLQLGVGLWGNYSEDSVVMVWDGQRILGNGADKGDGVIDKRTVADLQIGLGLSRYFSFSASVPVVMWQDGFDPASADNPRANRDLVASGLGDLRLSPKFVFVDLDQYPVGLAIIGEVSVPMGNGASFLGEGGVSATPMAALEFADGPVHGREYKVRFAMNAGYHVRNQAQFRDLALGNEFVYRAAIGFHPAPAVEFGADVAGALGGSRVAHRPLEVLPWLQILPHPLVTLRAGAGIGLLPGLGTPDYRVFVAGTLAPRFDPRSRDSDKDGIFNDKDQCVHDPEDLDQFQDADGCPDADNDKDGLADDDDQCPNDAEDADGYQDSDGCPDPDNDKDKILDDDDQCPNDAEVRNGYKDTDGCPDEQPIYDTDGDGFLDNKDRCPWDAEDVDGFKDDDGCPDADNDEDGILDEVDRCPMEKETPNGFEDDDGCPDEARPSRVVIERTRIRIDDIIQFEYNKATIKPESFGLMDEIADVMVSHPELLGIRVEGHTDSDGNDRYNLKLSQLRAESVVAYLVGRGVEKTRLDPVGFGEARPLVDNTTAENKQLNRRVEFVIVSQE
jgi:outer membrane protein OmpA-like peptidoglycan-associated protein